MPVTVSPHASFYLADQLTVPTKYVDIQLNTKNVTVTPRAARVLPSGLALPTPCERWRQQALTRSCMETAGSGMRKHGVNTPEHPRTRRYRGLVVRGPPTPVDVRRPREAGNEAGDEDAACGLAVRRWGVRQVCAPPVYLKEP